MAEGLESTRGLLRVGHRGAAGHAPENTLAAVERGIALGADFVELDVQSTRDGLLVLMHDRTVSRTTDGHGFVKDLTFEEIRKLDAGQGERVPSVAEVLSVANGKVGLILESITPGISLEIFQEVVQCGFAGPVIFASFHHADILAVRTKHPSANTMALLEGIPVSGASFAKQALANFVGVSMDSATRDFVVSLHEANVQVLVYTVNDPILIDAAKKLGVDGIISDFPDRL